MKKTCLIGFVIISQFSVLTARSQFTATSGAFSISASGYSISGSKGLPAGGESFSEQESSSATPFANFSETVAGSASWTVIPGRNDIFFLPGTGSASSTATASASFMNGVLDASIGTSASHTPNVGFPYLGVTASAAASFTGQFHVAEVMQFALEIQYFGLYPYTPYLPVFVLNASNGSISLDSEDLGIHSVNQPLTFLARHYETTGILLPGNYSLHFSSSGSSEFYPGGDEFNSSFQVKWSAVSIPENSSVATMLLASLGALILCARWQRNSLPVRII